MMNVFIGRAFRVERHKRGWTIEEALAHWPNEKTPKISTIARWERGANLPSLSALGDYAAVFGVDLSAIIASAEELKNEFGAQEVSGVPQG
jgi:transcriptional regulator with XRE-family HTH domain